ncbi:natural killer cells antigen CD94-like [Ornithorhynchus anatinus]|uniref:natural killer cells antigen CD94-like n=1 Tax=Ornithorhynchus anatinus TaxID=9258 RepID=UPI0010A82B55|nr:natural killer cells antigen CD94-like [Ornithorhynchus anatinus]
MCSTLSSFRKTATEDPNLQCLIEFLPGGWRAGWIPHHLIYPASSAKKTGKAHFGAEMSERNVTYVEATPSQESKIRHIHVRKEASIFISWRLLARILGVLGLLLLASVLAMGVLMAKRCHSGSCPAKWIWNSGNCYYISTKIKTWPESQTACRSMNSSLLKLENREELQDFLKLLKFYYWIGLSQNGSDGRWLWEDGSGLSYDLLSVQDHFSRGSCVHYGFSDQFSSQDCYHSTAYICKQRAI